MQDAVLFLTPAICARASSGSLDPSHEQQILLISFLLLLAHGFQFIALAG
jgi:hypothetical protein